MAIKYIKLSLLYVSNCESEVFVRLKSVEFKEVEFYEVVRFKEID